MSCLNPSNRRPSTCGTSDEDALGPRHSRRSRVRRPGTPGARGWPREFALTRPTGRDRLVTPLGSSAEAVVRDQLQVMFASESIANLRGIAAPGRTLIRLNAVSSCVTTASLIV